MSRTSILCALLLGALFGVATAQPNPGDLVVASLAGPDAGSFLAVRPGGSVQTFGTFNPGVWHIYSMKMDVNNNDLVFVGQDWATKQAILGRVTRSGAASTFAVLPGGIVEDVMVDEDGTYLVPLSVVPWLTLGRVTPGGVFTSILATPLSLGGSGRCITRDTLSGDAFVLYAALFRISRTGNVQIVTRALRSTYNFDIESDPRTGLLVVSQDRSLLYLNPAQAQVTTLAVGFPNVSYLSGLAYERRLDTFAVSGVGGLYRVARNGVVTTVRLNVHSLAVACYGSRNVAATAAPQVGSVFPLNFSDPSMPNAPYLAAASFATRPGIPLRIGVVDLQPGPLMALSLSAPWIFRGFVGQLDATGAANASIVIPGAPAISGTRFFVSFVTYNAGGVQSIANTAGFTIR